VAVARGAPIDPQHLPRHFRPQGAAPVDSRARPSAPDSFAAGGAQSASTHSRVIPLDEAERSLIAHALQEAQGNKALAARLLGVSRHQLYSKLERLGFPTGSTRR